MNKIQQVSAIELQLERFGITSSQTKNGLTVLLHPNGVTLYWGEDLVMVNPNRLIS